MSIQYAKFLFCLSCNHFPLMLKSSHTFVCSVCNHEYPSIHGVPCFVSDEFRDFSEVPPSSRSSFLKMKEATYFQPSMTRNLYIQYHQYARQQRLLSGKIPTTLDIGFGMGEHYPFISVEEKKKKSFIGVDIDRFKLEHFVASHRDVPVLQASAFKLPFRPESFDVVQLLATLEHFSSNQISIVLNEAVRVMKNNGILIVCYPAEGSILLRLGQIMMNKILRKKTGFDLDREEAHHHKLGGNDILGIICSLSMLQNIDTSYFPFKVPVFPITLFINQTFTKID